MALRFPGIPSSANIFKYSRSLGEGFPGLKPEDEEQKRISTTSLSNTDIDVETTNTLILQSPTNLEPGTYFVMASVNGEVFRELTNGQATMTIWLAHNSTEIAGSLTTQGLNVTASTEIAVSLATGCVYSFDGTEKISLYAVNTPDPSFIHDCQLSWIKISTDH